MIIFLLFGILAPQVNADVVSSAGCATFTRCSDCVFNAFSKELDTEKEQLSCAWCPSTKTCGYHNISCQHPMIREQNPTCDDMKCSAASVTGNIYICRPIATIIIVTAIALLIESIFYYLWYACINQMPWRFSNVHQALDSLGNATEAPTLQRRAPEGGSGNCPVCCVQYNVEFGPGEMCFWCYVRRHAFPPLALSATVGVIALVTIVFFSLKPSFADPYYIILLLVPHCVFAAWGFYITSNQVPVVGDPDKRLSSFVSLALTLHGRRLESLFFVPEEKVTPAIQSHTSPSDHLSMSIDIQAAHNDSINMLELATSVPQAFRKKIQDDLKHDEYILWWEKPTPFVVHLENRWLLHTCANGVGMGIFLLLVGSLPKENYPRVLLDGAVLRLIGLICGVVFLILLASVYVSCERVQVLSNKRILIITNGLLGSQHNLYVELDRIGHASISGFQELGYNVATFSWGFAEKKLRRMPVTRIHSFVGVSNIDTLLTQFLEIAPTLESTKVIEENAHRVTTWKLYIVVHTAIAVVAPIILVATEVLPTGLNIFGLALWWSTNASMIQRGWRYLSTTFDAVSHKAPKWTQWSRQGFSMRRLMSFGGLFKERHEGV